MKEQTCYGRLTSVMKGLVSRLLSQHESSAWQQRAYGVLSSARRPDFGQLQERKLELTSVRRATGSCRHRRPER